MYNYRYMPRYGDFKDFDTIKPGSILDMVQDVSIRASTECGYDINTMKNMNIAWLMQGINVRFDRKINPYDMIEISTGVRKMKGAVSERCCIISQNGENVGKTVACWFILDINRQRPGRIPKEMFSAYTEESFDDKFFIYKKAECDDSAIHSYSIKVSNKEIDTNMHLNNQKGAELLMDALPFDFNFNEFNVFYRQPAFLGDELDVCVKQTENGYYVHLAEKEKGICVAGIFSRNS